MSNLNVNVAHNLGQEKALERIKNLLGNLKEEQKALVGNIKEEWNGNTGKFGFSAQGFDLAGTIAVTDASVDINADLPFALSFFKGMIADVIEKKTKELLA
ncbi:MAG: polyhydroxyalkanoic acid system family protein [Gemmatimonadaceae bacterium]|nr:polyhydroxyalkanoic acid system family protein [Chitinophagaceae bacterium]